MRWWAPLGLVVEALLGEGEDFLLAGGEVEGGGGGSLGGMVVGCLLLCVWFGSDRVMDNMVGE